MKRDNLIPCACKSLAESVQSGDEIRARMDAVRVIAAALDPFDVDARGRIMRAACELVGLSETDADFIDDDE